VTLSNDGPATATKVEYSLASLEEHVPPFFKAGPWSVDRLKPGETDERDVYGFYAPVVMMTATWTDGDGDHDLSWTIEFPDRPRTPATTRCRAR
jgi:hypothetical protein